MKEKLQSIRELAEQAMAASKDARELDAIRVKYLGKKGEVTALMKNMRNLAPEERPAFGQLVNDLRASIEAGLAENKARLEAIALEAKLKSETIDVTMPGEEVTVGTKHPISTVLDEVKDIFIGMGFSIGEGPEVEKDWYNFEALNIPKDHPARDTQDTFYISDNVVLRTQTSPIQIRTMEHKKPPIRIIAPGRVFRSDAVDATHSPLFHQIEGLVVDKGIRMSDLKGILEMFAKKLYGEDTVVRFRPHHFPFTEPSAEMDMQCFQCHGEGCPLCKGEGWIEILGCGMVHPKVLEVCGIDPDEYSGYAFGIGLERIVMSRYKINDIRMFYENDVRFLHQF
ncbi:phenylalanine--tRNA ligase subunit alpha [Butyricicoccus porcorum]|uniref:Phenylalanine--tRNA ligase alpha subunit n=1 Tax=Butyricicoccus porcorum TaxID=1945634 RepID=A0A252F214_9FIRM|nr:phenylalanine--tRNA ligase subunit alpha [Butyricicoccus porcorum]MCI6927374.1 phenylalanine--tRNA ligase subunit alpha [Butyricicoccus porcorum]MDD6986464.1 phenylalanine--tRNA ligase subunit alpha [Butyricicoccus porcorum]MDY4483763.1 phenylalanine--tRNA ligase subunit alpha [Butyricicoccus porcorum]OUM19833.1 phenylalanine--tRNA ligase subunit alpha [Butyricicoccus porcorum]